MPVFGSQPSGMEEVASCSQAWVASEPPPYALGTVISLLEPWFPRLYNGDSANGFIVMVEGLMG